MSEPSTEAILPAHLSWVGTVGHGPTGSVDRSGTVQTTESGLTVSVWLGAEDGWRTDNTDRGTRQSFPESLPIPQTLVRVPSGDVEIRTFGAVSAGSGRPAITMSITNASPLPVAVAIVVSSESGDAELSVDRDGVVDGGIRCVALSGVRDALVASSPASLAERLASGVVGDGGIHGEFDQLSPAVGAIVPLSHTSTTVVSVVESTPVPGATAEQDSLPPFDKVVDGWESHLGRAPQIDLGRDELAAGFRLARAVVAIGAGPEATLNDELLRVAAAGVLGELSGVDIVIEAALRSQRSRGAVVDVDGQDATVAFIMAATSMWDAGIEPHHAESLVGPLAKACRWIGGGRGLLGIARRRTPGAGARTVIALHRAAEMLRDLGQHEAADEIASLPSALSGSADAIRATLGRYRHLMGGSAWGMDTTAPEFGLSAQLVDSVVWSAVRTSGRRIHLCDFWTPPDAGVSVDIREVPTRLGVVSASLRWHGARPALLWEVQPQPGRSDAEVEVVLPALDSSWSSTDLSGETLLEMPAMRRPAV